MERKRKKSKAIGKGSGSKATANDSDQEERAATAQDDRFSSDEAPELQDLLAASDAADSLRKRGHSDAGNQEADEQQDGPEQTKDPSSLNWSTIGLDDIVVMEAFQKSLPGPVTDFTYSPDLLKKAAVKGEASNQHGYSDEMYALDMAYVKWKSERT